MLAMTKLRISMETSKYFLAVMVETKTDIFNETLKRLSAVFGKNAETLSFLALNMCFLCTT